MVTLELCFAKIVFLSADIFSSHDRIGDFWKNFNFAWQEECLKPFLQLTKILLSDAGVILVDNWLNIDGMSRFRDLLSFELIVAHTVVTSVIKPVSLLWHPHWLVELLNVRESLDGGLALVGEVTERSLSL